MAREAEILISSDGSKVEIAGKTFQGKTCVDFSTILHKALGEVEEQKKLPEFYVGPKQSVSH